MDSIYQKLVEVRLWHDFFLGEENVGPQIPLGYQISDFMSIQATGETQNDMKRCRLLFKPMAGGFMVFTEIKEGTPIQTLLKMKDPVKLSFVLSLTDPLFLNYTNVSLGAIKNSLFYFSNLDSNILFLGGSPYFYLSQPLPAFANGTSYNRGDLVRGNNEVFEVISTPVSAAPIAGNTQIDWAEGKNTQYASSQDVLARYSETYSYEGLNTAPDSPAIFEIRDQFGRLIPLGNKVIPGENIPIEQTVFPPASQNRFNYRLSIQRLSTGRYSIYLNGNLIEAFYKLNTLQYPRAIGIVELFHLPLGSSLGSIPAGYKFINPGPDPSNPLSIPVERTFQIHFKSRMTRWRYLRSEDQSVFHTTDRPLALSRSFTDVVVGGTKMPNPTARILKGESGSDQLFSVVYL